MDKPPLTIAQITPRGERAVVTCSICGLPSISKSDELSVQITAEVHYVTAHGKNRAPSDWARPWQIAGN